MSIPSSDRELVTREWLLEAAVLRRASAKRLRSIQGCWPAPSRKINGFLTLGKLHCRYECAIKITFNEPAFDTQSQKVRPQKLAERCRILCESPRAPQFAGQRAER